MTDLVKSTEDPEVKLSESQCISCRGTMVVELLHGIVLQEYLDYRREGGEECTSCYIGLTVDREKPMNRQEWWDGAPLSNQEESYVLRHAPIDGLRESF